MGWDFAGADQHYARAFAWYGLDVGVSERDATEVAHRMRGSAIGSHLIAGIDDWAAARDRVGRESGRVLRSIADLADDDPWRRRLRAAVVLAARTPPWRRWRRKPRPTASRRRIWCCSARALDEAGNWGAAERLLRRAQSRYLTEFWVNLELALSLSFKKAPDWIEAVRFYQAALAVRPLSPGVLTNFGVALYKTGRIAEAVEAYRKAIQLEPDIYQAHQNLGVALAAQRKLSDAVEAFGKALELEPALPEAHTNLGNALQQQGKLAEAVATYRIAVSHWPELAKAHYLLGNALLIQQKPMEAEAAYRAAIKLRSDMRKAHASLGSALQAQGRLPEAVAAFRKAIALKDDSAVTYFNLGNALQAQGNPSEAVAAYRKAIEFRHDYAEAYFNLGNALQAQGNPSEAVAAYRKAIELRPDQAEAYCNLGLVLLSQEQFAEALTFLRRGHQVGSRNPNWPNPSADWVQLCERLLRLESKLPDLLSGKVQPADMADRMALAVYCGTPRSVPRPRGSTLPPSPNGPRWPRICEKATATTPPVPQPSPAAARDTARTSSATPNGRNCGDRRSTGSVPTLPPGPSAPKSPPGSRNRSK